MLYIAYYKKQLVITEVTVYMMHNTCNTIYYILYTIHLPLYNQK